MKEWILEVLNDSSGNLMELLSILLLAGLIGVIIICIRGLLYRTLDIISVPVGRLIEKMVHRK